MPYSVDWLDEARQEAIVLHYIGTWTWADLREADRRLGEMLDAVDRTVYVVGDYTQSERLQGSPVEARKMINNTVQTTHPNIERAMVVALPEALKSMLVIYNRFFANSARTMLTFSTMEEACQWIAAHPLNE